MFPVSGAEQLKHSEAQTLRPIASAQWAYSAWGEQKQGGWASRRMQCNQEVSVRERQGKTT